jgi:hypothetical protein
LRDVLQGNLLPPPPREPNNDVGRYVVAALVNNDRGFVAETILRRRAIQHIWTEFITSGRFTPMPGAFWIEFEIVDYLKSTMTSA